MIMTMIITVVVVVVVRANVEAEGIVGEYTH